VVSGIAGPVTRQRPGVPRVPHDTVDRPRIFALLDRRAPITFVCAPMGWGKRTVVASWFHQRAGDDLTVHWVKRPADIATAPTTAGLIVLEADDEGVEEHLDEFIDRLKYDDTLFLVVLARRQLDAQLRAQHAVETAFLGIDDLRFDDDEVAELFTRRGTIIDRCSIVRLNASLDGWPLLVHRAALLLDPGVRTPEDVDAALEAVRSHLTDVLLPAVVPEELLGHLTQLSLVGHLDRETAAVALDLELEAAEEVLEALAGAGLLKAATGLRDRTFEMVPQVREVLRPRATHPGVVHRALVARHMARGEWNEALLQGMAMGDALALAKIVEKSWAFISLSRRALLMEVLERLPERLFDQRPELRTVRVAMTGMALPDTGPFDTLPADAATLEALGAADATGEALTHHLTMVGVARYSGRFEESLEFLAKLRTMATSALRHHGPAVPVIGPMVFIHEGVTLQLTGRLEQAVASFRDAISHDVHDAEKWTTRDAEGSLAMHYAIRGEMGEARRWARQEARRPRPAGWFERRVAVAGNVARAWLAIEAGERERSAEILLDLVRQRDDDELWPFILYAQTAHELLWGDLRAMLADLQDFAVSRRVLTPPGSMAEVVVAVCESDLRLALGHGAAAAAVLAEAPQHPAVTLRRARFALLQGEFDQVLALELGVRGQAPRYRAEMDLLRAAALGAKGEDAAGRELTEKAVELMRRHGLTTPWAGVPAAMRPARLEVPVVFPDAVEVIDLTPSEELVLDGLAAGLSAERIAERAYLSVNTIKTHNRTLYRKLGVRSRGEALTRARALGLRE